MRATRVTAPTGFPRFGVIWSKQWLRGSGPPSHGKRSLQLRGSRKVDHAKHEP